LAHMDPNLTHAVCLYISPVSQFHSRHPKNEESMAFWNVDILRHHYVVSQPGRPWHESSPPWKSPLSHAVKKSFRFNSS
jgi:hypothetical protein